MILEASFSWSKCAICVANRGSCIASKRRPAMSGDVWRVRYGGFGLSKLAQVWWLAQNFLQVLLGDFLYVSRHSTCELFGGNPKQCATRAVLGSFHSSCLMSQA